MGSSEMTNGNSFDACRKFPIRKWGMTGWFFFRYRTLWHDALAIGAIYPSNTIVDLLHYASHSRTWKPPTAVTWSIYNSITRCRGDYANKSLGHFFHSRLCVDPWDAFRETRFFSSSFSSIEILFCSECWNAIVKAAEYATVPESMENYPLGFHQLQIVSHISMECTRMPPHWLNEFGESKEKRKITRFSPRINNALWIALNYDWTRIF